MSKANLGDTLVAAKPNAVLIKLYLRNLLRALEEKAEWERAMKELGVKNTRVN
jgi:hypothetical protein